MKKAAIFVALMLSGLPAAMAEPLPAFSVASIISGDELVLSDHRTVKLEGIAAPAPDTQELADQARAKLEKVAVGKPLLLENTSTDRYGRITAQVFIVADDGTRTRLQEIMLREGLAFIYPPSGQEPDLAGLFAAEYEARIARRGIWADRFYADVPDTKAWWKYGKFGFISGTVLKAERVKEKFYLNFGDDWKKDFTITIAAHDLQEFRKANIDPLTYQGKAIRVRGWVIRNFGPMITVTNPAQIEIISNP